MYVGYKWLVEDIVDDKVRNLASSFIFFGFSCHVDLQRVNGLPDGQVSCRLIIRWKLTGELWGPVYPTKNIYILKRTDTERVIKQIRTKRLREFGFGRTIEHNSIRTKVSEINPDLFTTRVDPGEQVYLFLCSHVKSSRLVSSKMCKYSWVLLQISSIVSVHLIFLTVRL